MSKKGRVIRDHDPEFRREAGRLVIEQGAGVSETALSLGIATTTLHGWVRRFRDGTWSLETPTAPGGKLPPSSQKKRDHLQDLESKNRELEAKLKRLTMERDILRKSMAYFVDVPK